MTRRPRLPTPGRASAAFSFLVSVALVSGAAGTAAGLLAGCTAAVAGDPAASAPGVPEQPRVIGPGSSRQPPVAGSAATPTAAAHAEALSRVESLIGEPRCDADAQCHTVAVGARACGGPTGYRAWSDRVTDAQALKDASDRERQLAVQAEREARRVSPCLYLADPGAQCVRGRCETRQASPMPSAR